VIYPSRSVERIQDNQFADLLALARVRRIYLDELEESAADALGTGVVKLVVASGEAAPDRAKQLIAKAREQLADEIVRANLINLIETIVVYKLPQKSREEIAAMLGLLSELKETRFYQEVFEEGRLEGIEEGRLEGIEEGRLEGIEEGRQQGVLEGKSEGIEEGRIEAKRQAIAPMLQLDLSLDVIARVLDLPLAEVEQMTAQIQQETRLKIEQKTLAKFIELLIQQRTLFSHDDLMQLEQLVDLLPDEMDILFQVISRWLERHPTLQEAHATLMESTDEALGESRERQPQNLPNKQALQAAISRFYLN
jgi:predicted transposase YdaD